MKALLLVALSALLVPLASADEARVPYEVYPVTASASNQRVELSWAPPSESDVAGYNVYVFDEGQFSHIVAVNSTKATLFLTNGRSYAFQVAAVTTDGVEGPRSAPVAATPHLENDLAYLAAGLIAVWIGVFGYAAFLARKEASIDRKLEQLLQARFQGRSP
jgi:CcmD family protein